MPGVWRREEGASDDAMKRFRRSVRLQVAACRQLRLSVSAAAVTKSRPQQRSAHCLPAACCVTVPSLGRGTVSSGTKLKDDCSCWKRRTPTVRHSSILWYSIIVILSKEVKEVFFLASLCRQTSISERTPIKKQTLKIIGPSNPWVTDLQVWPGET